MSQRTCLREASRSEDFELTSSERVNEKRATVLSSSFFVHFRISEWKSERPLNIFDEDRSRPLERMDSEPAERRLKTREVVSRSNDAIDEWPATSSDGEARSRCLSCFKQWSQEACDSDDTKDFIEDTNQQMEE